MRTPYTEYAQLVLLVATSAYQYSTTVGSKLKAQLCSMFAKLLVLVWSTTVRRYCSNPVQISPQPAPQGYGILYCTWYSRNRVSDRPVPVQLTSSANDVTVQQCAWTTQQATDIRHETRDTIRATMTNNDDSVTQGGNNDNHNLR